MANTVSVSSACFGHPGLRKRIHQIKPKVPNSQCSFLPKKRGIPVTEVAKIVDEIFRKFYSRKSHVNAHAGGKSLTEALRELTKAEEDSALSALAEALIDAENCQSIGSRRRFYDRDYIYGRKFLRSARDYQHSITWINFHSEILDGQRFFNKKALEYLKMTFKDLYAIKDNKGKHVVYSIDAGTEFYRARVVTGKKMRKKIESDPAANLGPPPRELRTAGRMNPSGVMAFYGAFDKKTCIAELRPTVGGMVAVARFSLNEPILVLDTTAFTRIHEMDIFAKRYTERASFWRFMNSFGGDIAKPCLPNDEHLEYIPTQVVSEYLTHLHQLKGQFNGKNIDGIIYPSAQRNVIENGDEGKNIVIFKDSGLVEDSQHEASRQNKSKYGLRVVKDSLRFLYINGAEYRHRMA